MQKQHPAQRFSSCFRSRLIPTLGLCFLAAAASVAGSPACAADVAQPLALTNAGFEDGATGWTLGDQDAAAGLSKFTTTGARSGKSGLTVLVADADAAPTGSSIVSDRLEVAPDTTYRVTFHARVNSQSGIGVMFQYYNAQHAVVSDAKQIMPQEATDWADYSMEATAPAGAAYARIYIHSWSKHLCNVDFDDFTFSKIAASSAVAPAPAAKP